jgi:hypothetical protein
MSYHELWTVVSNWRKEFSSGEFARTFYSPDPNKVLHDMTKKGMFERIGIGRYRVRDMKEYVFSRNDVRKAYSLLHSTPLPYALTSVDAVYVWTHGGYNADRFFGFYPIHMKVKKEDLAKWKRFFAKNGYKAIVNGKRPGETLFGTFFVLYPEHGVAAKEVESLMVDSLDKTVEFCKKNIYTFEPALEMLDERYHLHLEAKYRG